MKHVFAILCGLLLYALPARAEEFRAAWVATVWNLDWPSKPALSSAAQKQELISLLDHAKKLGLNQIIFQVRPAGDTLYQSPFEPWSAFLTGSMGRPPEPFYDPLDFAVKESHRRGLKLHAWINPFRVQSGKFSFAPNHISRTKPQWVRRHGDHLWLDPGLPEVRQHVLKISRDLLTRYAVDGIHIDDYFYPYPPSGQKTKTLHFPDAPTYAAYRKSGGTLTLNDWRRDNINQFVRELHSTVKSTRRDALFGISPFGIWRPGLPEGTSAGLDAYEHLCADSRYWLQQGWCDYFSPQLYWRIDQKEQSFPVLLKWWHEQNVRKVNLWPGIASDRVGKDRPASEIARQIAITRNILDRPGHIHWSYSALRENRKGLADLLRTGVYRETIVSSLHGSMQ